MTLTSITFTLALIKGLAKYDVENNIDNIVPACSSTSIRKKTEVIDRMLNKYMSDLRPSAMSIIRPRLRNGSFYEVLHFVLHRGL